MLIVDDHDGFRSLAKALLEAEGFDVVGEAVDAVGALDAAAPSSASSGRGPLLGSPPGVADGS